MPTSIDCLAVPTRQMPVALGGAVEDLFENSPALLCVLELDGRFLRANAACTRRLGYTLDEFRAGRILDLVHPKYRDQLAAELDALRVPESATSFDLLFRCRDGNHDWLRWSCRRPTSASVIHAVIDDLEGEKRLAELMQAKLDVATLTAEVWRPFAVKQDVDALVHQWAESLAQRIPSAAVAIWLVPDQGAGPVLKAVSGSSGAALAAPLRFAQHDVEQVLSTGEPRIIVDLAADVRWREGRLLPDGRRIAAVAIHPLTAQGVVKGCVGALLQGHISNRMLHSVATAAAEMSIVLGWLTAESQHRKAHGILRTLSSCAPLGLIELDAAGTVLSWNPAAERILGWARDDVVGCPFPALSENQTAFEQLVASAVAGKASPPLQTAATRRDGTRTHVALTVAPQGAGAGAVAIITDTSQRQRTERYLALHSEAARILADSQPFDAVVPRLLEAVCRTLEWDGGEYWIIDAATKAARRCAVWPTLASATSTASAGIDETPLSAEDGLPAQVRRDAAPVWIPHSRPRQLDPRGRASTLECHDAVGFPVVLGKEVVGVLHFVAGHIAEPDGELRTMMAAIAGRITDFLECRRVQATLDAAEANLRQSQKMESIGLLVGGVAHDFNNLLTVVIANSEIGAESLNADDPLRELLHEIELAGKRGAALTKQLLGFSRKHALDPVIININDHIAEMERMVRHIIGKEIELDTALEPDVYGVKADPIQFEQVLLNLVVNARDAMPSGGALTIRTANVHPGSDGLAGLPETIRGPCAVLTVRDTGCGMDEATKARIFEPFFTTKEKGKGTGMGLATVFGIIRDCGGQVTVESQVAQGTAFKVYLPRARDALLPRQVDCPPEPVPRGTETVLVVDDEDNVRRVVCSVLQVQGYTTLEAASGAEALELCQRHKDRLQLVLSDVVMPEMSGRKLADRLAVLHPHIKRLLMSGCARGDNQPDGDQNGEPPLLQKPFTSDVLARKVRQVLDG